MLRNSVDNGFYTIAEAACCGIEIDAAEIIADGVELMIALRECTGRTEIKRPTVSRKDGVGLIDGILLEQGRKQQLILFNVVNLEVRGVIEDLDTIGMSTVERLS